MPWLVVLFFGSGGGAATGCRNEISSSSHIVLREVSFSTRHVGNSSLQGNLNWIFMPLCPIDPRWQGWRCAIACVVGVLHGRSCVDDVLLPNVCRKGQGEHQSAVPHARPEVPSCGPKPALPCRVALWQAGYHRAPGRRLPLGRGNQNGRSAARGCRRQGQVLELNLTTEFSCTHVRFKGH